jgi:hypothetical protein
VLKLSNIAVGNKSLEEVVDAQIIREVSEEMMARLAAECLSLTRGERPP